MHFRSMWQQLSAAATTKIIITPPSTTKQTVKHSIFRPLNETNYPSQFVKQNKTNKQKKPYESRAKVKLFNALKSNGLGA